MKCLEKDREALLTFYDFPAEHWGHLRTSNPIESTFATVRLRTNKTRNCVSRESIFAMVFKWVQGAEKRWHRLRGYNLLADVITGVKFSDGIKQEQQDQDAA
jgi:putative transposase